MKLKLFIFIVSFSLCCNSWAQDAEDPIDPIEDPSSFAPPEDWCPPQPCNCSFTVSSQGSTDVFVGEGETVCLSGTFTINRNIQPAAGASNYSICILPEANITLQDRPGPIAGGLDRLHGNWTLYNNGNLTSQGYSQIRNGQSLYNQGNFKTVGGALVIAEAGLFCNSGESIIDGDIRNFGTLKSSGYLESLTEFKNFASGEVWITDLVVKDEITNEGDLYLRGTIRSIDKSFNNSGNVIGLDNTCNAILVNRNVTNTGTMDGSGGDIAIGYGLGIDGGNYGGGGQLVPGVYFDATEELEGENEACFSILPVTFVDFEAVLENDRSTRLLWSTSKEWENSHFEVERSFNNVHDFIKISQITGRGWADDLTTYTYQDDKLPLMGGNVFYRLKQVDFNGNFEYSDITAVRVPNVHFTKGVWRAYPNPSQGADFQLELVDVNQYNDEPVTMRVLSSTLGSDEMTFKDLHELNQSATAIMANAPTGLWIIELQWGNKVERIKVIKK